MSELSSQQLRRALVLYFAGYFLSMVGTAATQAADGWLAYRVTRSEYFLGCTALLLQVPYVVFSILAIKVLQRVNLKRCLIGVYLVFGASSLVFGAYASVEPLPAPVGILLFSVTQGICHALEVPARLSILPQIVPQQSLGKVLTWTSINWNLTRVVGPIVAGWMILRAGEAGCFILDGATYFLVACTIWCMPIRDVAPRQEHRSLRVDAGALWGMYEFRVSVYSIFVASSIAGIYLTFLPSLVTEVQGSPHMLGILRGLVGAGGVVSACVLFSWRSPEIIGRYLPRVALGMGVMVVVGMAATYFAPLALYAHGIVAIVIGGLWTLVGGGGNILVQRLLSDVNRAVGSTLWSMAFYLPYAVGPIVSSVLFARFNFEVGLGIIGCLASLFGILILVDVNRRRQCDLAV